MLLSNANALDQFRLPVTQRTQDTSDQQTTMRLKTSTQIHRAKFEQDVSQMSKLYAETTKASTTRNSNRPDIVPVLQLNATRMRNAYQPYKILESALRS